MFNNQVIAIRAFDVIFALIGLLLTFPLIILLTLLIAIDGGRPIFVQKRVGKHKKPFYLFKFRTMSLDTESVASHEVDVGKVTQLGRFIRRKKFDELPQLINVLSGSMSLVGPRPCLFSQQEVIEARDSLSLNTHKPGITGLSQTSGVDMSTPQILAERDAIMMKSFSIKKYFYMIYTTIFGNISGDAIYRKGIEAQYQEKA